ncbi:hypothetical protein X801_03198, partial [Opisthorchis viverrini]
KNHGGSCILVTSALDVTTSLLHTSKLSQLSDGTSRSQGRITVGEEVVFQGENRVLVDSGTSFTFGPKVEVVAINKRLTQEAAHHGVYIVDCRRILNFPLVKFSNGDSTLTLSPREYIFRRGQLCFSSFAYRVGITESFWRFGAALNRMFYTVYDKEEERVGFARSKIQQDP